MSTKVNLFGAGVELPKDNLPSVSDVIRHTKFLNGEKLHGVDFTVRNKVAEAVISVWRTVSSSFCEPITSKDVNISKKIGRMLQRAYECEAGLAKKAVKKTFVDECDKVFSILLCDCDILSCAEFGCQGCSKQVHLSTKCKHSSEMRIPEPLLIFLRYLASCVPLKQA